MSDLIGSKKMINKPKSKYHKILKKLNQAVKADLSLNKVYRLVINCQHLLGNKPALTTIIKSKMSQWKLTEENEV